MYRFLKISSLVKRGGVKSSTPPAHINFANGHFFKNTPPTGPSPVIRQTNI